MPQSTTTLTVGDICEGLDERLEEIAAEAADEEDGSTDQRQLDQAGVTLDQQLRAFEALEEEHGADAVIEVAELTPHERSEFVDLLDVAREQWADKYGVESRNESLRDIYWVAACVVDAPWLDGDEGLQERAVKTRVEPNWHVIQFLKSRVTEENSLGNGKRRSYAERREEKTPGNERS